MIVGLAGKACAGKDTLVPFFVERGYTIVDADRVGHRALEANRDAVLARFGTVDRRELGRVVFSSARALADLEAITHPWIRETVRHEMALAPGSVLVHAALLHRLDLAPLCDVVIWVQASLFTRARRARRRDGWSWKRVFQRIWAQRKLGPQVFGPNVDILRVDNEGSPERARKVLELRFGPTPTFPQKEDTHEE